MGWTQGGGVALRRIMTKREAKICPLCGTLNYERNTECYTCNWQGGFEQDDAAMDYQWQRLLDRHEEVRLEHLTGRGMKVLDEFGVARRRRPWQWLQSACQRRWQTFLARRNARCAEREARLLPKTSSRLQ